MNPRCLRDYALEASRLSALLASRRARLHADIQHKWATKRLGDLETIPSAQPLISADTRHGLPPLHGATHHHEELDKNLNWLLASLAASRSTEWSLLPMTVPYFIDMLRHQFPDAAYIRFPQCDDLIIKALSLLESRNLIRLDELKLHADDREETLVIIDIGRPSGHVKPLPSLKSRHDEILTATYSAYILKLDIWAGATSVLQEVEDLITKQSFKEKQVVHIWGEIDGMLARPSAKSQLVNEKFKNKEDVLYREFCEWGLRADCRKRHSANHFCTKLHFRRIMLPQTDIKLGDCSYLNTCHHMDTCKFVHYEFDENVRGDIERPLPVLDVGNPLPAQWINCDVRRLDYTILGKFSVIMADPPWDIHMQLPYGTMTDEEMKSMPISVLQDEGYIFLWVTGRAIELGRECLITWGYDRVDELIWVKTNQIQKLIRTGRTGHWFNHSKEHCIIGVKRRSDGVRGDMRNGKQFNVGIDTDVLVAEVRETSWKPDEIYGLIDRLSPGTRKLEIFGRQHNTRDGWMTLGNQLDGVRIVEPDVLERYSAAYPNRQV
ncbi:hypothetical protein SeMB42_g06354 [Synchytrium endobioticum]|nr:hypothetical protein SeMB42_g06354 [Synchytrium endobioticum]